MPDNDLIDFIESVSGDSHLAIEENLGEGFVRLKTAEAERRQAKHDIRCVEDIVIEMLRNARDAHAEHVYLAISRDGDIKSLVFIDDGDGIPFDMQARIFEPRVTSKLDSMVMDSWGVHGRGMALYSIKSNVLDAHVQASLPENGSSLSVMLDLEELPEKTDQSSMPVLGYDDEGDVVVATGPHNINRVVAEFALEAKEKLEVYVGSPAEIAATLVQAGGSSSIKSQLLFARDMQELPVCLRPAAAGNADELMQICSGIGLEMSSRTAYRILTEEIMPLEPLLTQLESRLGERKGAAKKIDIYRDSRGLRVSKDDLQEFSRTLETAFETLAKRYYIEPVDEPIIRVGKDAVTVKFPFDKEL